MTGYHYYSIMYWQVPVYTGCGVSMLGVGSAMTGYHGDDGLGDVLDEDPVKTDEILQKQHAVQALIQLVNQNPGV